MIKSLLLKSRIQQIECMLSPENLYMDGEADPAEANRRGRELQKELESLLKQERAELKKEYFVEQGKIDFNG